ncbi:murG domain protein [Bordetella holmesii 41130]|nr:murG domain protein [Bordetella holmesii 41130]EWM51561.1 murG domain protein [Bordetella holmesii 70147]
MKLPLLLTRAVVQAWGHLSAIKPDVVLGMGGMWPSRAGWSRHCDALPW